MLFKLVLRHSVIALALLSCAVFAAAQNADKWNYYGKTGPLGWAKLDPSYKACSSGRQQSPLDIHGTRLNKDLKPIEFHYLTGNETVENNGRTIVVHVNPGSYVVANGTRYNLIQYEFR